MASQRLHTNKRSYFFNIYENEDDSNIIEIVESKSSKTGSFQKNKIIVFAEDMEIFIKKLASVIDKKCEL